MGSVADPPHKGKTLHLRRATLLLTCHCSMLELKMLKKSKPSLRRKMTLENGVL